MLSALTQWSFEPVPVLGCALAAVLYTLGLRSTHASRRGAAAFYVGLTVLFLALVSPLDGLDVRWQWVHMTQHILLLVVAPPLLLLGRPFATAAAGLRVLRPQVTVPHQLQRVHARVPRGRGSAMLVLALFCADLLIWHIPALYNLTLQVEPVHDLEHTLFLATGLLYWDQVIRGIRAPVALSLASRGVLLLAGMAASWALAVLIGYASQPLYAYTPQPGGPSVLQDQQIAAGVMWVPGSIPFVAALIWLLIVWFELDDRAAAVRTDPST